MTEDIGRSIEEARKRPLTAENLNYIGDLYRRKGDRATAIVCYYDAAEKLHFAQKEKKIAIYKKVISLSPSDEKAFEQLIFLFAKLGLSADEKNYLMQLVKVYEGKGEYNKINSLFRRILEIDPKDEFALSFFSKGKLDETEDLPPAAPLPKPAAAPPLPRPAIQENHVPPQAEEIFSTAEPERAPRISDPSHRNVLIGAAALIAAAVVIFFAARMIRSSRVAPPLQQAVRLASANLQGFAVAVDSLSAADALQSGADAASQTALRIEIRSAGSCIPQAFVSGPAAMVSLTDKGGNSLPVLPAKGEDAVRVIYRTNACEQESAAVFLGLKVLHDRKKLPAELRLAGLSGDAPLMIPLTGAAAK